MRKTGVALLVLAAVPVLAQQQAIPDVSVKPLQVMQSLAPLAGDWTMTVYSTNDDGETWQATPTQSVAIEYRHKGFMLEEVPSDLESPGFHMRTTITYDQYRDVFRKAALDDIWGILDLYEGNIVDGRLVLDNLKSGTLFPLEDGRWRGFRLTMELTPAHRWMWIDKTDDQGQTWQPAFKAEYLQSSD
jgi:hypothetical protein